MVRRPVDSTSIVSVGYEPAARTLEIEFVSGGVYRYFNVPPAIYAAFLAAESKGTFVNTVVKPRYRYARVS
jgi:hypothetical protein